MTRNPSSNGKKLKSKDVITRDEKNPTKKSSNRRKGGDDEPKKKKGSIPKKNDSKKGAEEVLRRKLFYRHSRLALMLRTEIVLPRTSRRPRSPRSWDTRSTSASTESYRSTMSS
ncbi:hypothetical protein L596_030211 [Steinernema carpocapsae]|uniref:Uncharacterized protein n=1 Tax=Steinernema carpocapsae TaxID=34508 RepID=A0A4U5LS20_STECR|nr:hypothetical protein L596_030211 [Steinernema carpocapsae]